MITNAQNPNVGITDLDSVFFQKWDEENVAPGQATARTTSLFRPYNTQLSAYQEEIFKGGGLWDKTGETEIINTTDTRTTNKLTTSVADFTDSRELSKNWFDDEHHNVWQNTVRDFAVMARQTQTDRAMRFWRNAFTNSLGADGVSIINASHDLIGGGTENNLVTGELNDTNLNNAFNSLQEQKNQAGVIMGGMPAILLVPNKLFKIAKQVTASQLISGSGNNDLNYYSQIFPGLMVLNSNYLGAKAGGSDTAWFLLTENHKVTRLIRQGMDTALTHWSYSRNRTYVYQGNFREETYCADYSGIVGSLGV